VQPFSYQRAESAEAAVRAAGRSRSAATQASAQYLAGGTTLLDLMKTGAMAPERLVDINDLAPRYGRIAAGPDGLRLGALVRMSEAAAHPAVRRDYPVIADALALAASQQLRNMASLGGNVLQRTRCRYFRDPSWPACNKRSPGSGCGALEGVNRLHAVLGVSEACIASYPGDFGQALAALGASVEVLGAAGPRVIAFDDLHVGPGETPQVETTLAAGELITGFHVPAGPWTRRSLYLKVRDRESYEFALASVAAAVRVEDDAIAEVRLALGGVATKPWRARLAEASLLGRPATPAAFADAAAAELAPAAPRALNAFKVELARRAIVRALTTLTSRPQ
jgi:xanthine dehydrogenase YagS FAD-binding subunit